MTDGGDNKSRISLPKLEKERISRSTGGEVVRISSAEIAGKERVQLDKLAPGIVGQVEGVYHLELGLSEVEQAARVKVAFVDRARIKNTRSIAYSYQIVPCQRRP